MPKIMVKIVGVNIDDEIAAEFHFDNFRLWLKIRGSSFETQKYYITYLKTFLKHSQLKEMSDFNNFLKIKIAYNKLFDRNFVNSTYDKYRKMLIQYYRCLIEMEVMNENYGNKLSKVKQHKPIPKSLTEDELEQINEYILHNYTIDFYRYRSYVLFNTIVYTGLRRSEVANLKKEDVYTQKIIVRQGKGAKDRVVAIPKTYSKMICDYLEIQDKNDEYVFCNIKGKYLGKDGVNRIFNKIKKGTGINVYPHILRHTYATLCVKRGINLHTLQQQMGHCDLKTTSIYLYMNSKENWEEMQKLG